MKHTTAHLMLKLRICGTYLHYLKCFYVFYKLYSCQFLTTETVVQFQVSPVLICGKQSGTGAAVLLNIKFLPPVTFLPASSKADTRQPFEAAVPRVFSLT